MLTKKSIITERVHSRYMTIDAVYGRKRLRLCRAYKRRPCRVWYKSRFMGLWRPVFFRRNLEGRPIGHSLGYSVSTNDKLTCRRAWSLCLNCVTQPTTAHAPLSTSLVKT